MSACIRVASSSSVPIRSFSAVTFVRFSSYSVRSFSISAIISARFSSSSPVLIFSLEKWSVVSMPDFLSFTYPLAASAMLLRGSTSFFFMRKAVTRATILTITNIDTAYSRKNIFAPFTTLLSLMSARKNATVSPLSSFTGTPAVAMSPNLLELAISYSLPSPSQTRNFETCFSETISNSPVREPVSSESSGSTRCIRRFFSASYMAR